MKDFTKIFYIVCAVLLVVLSVSLVTVFSGGKGAVSGGGSGSGSGSSSGNSSQPLTVHFSEIHYEATPQTKNEKGPVLPGPDTDYLVQVAVKTNIEEFPNKDILYGFYVSFSGLHTYSYNFYTEDLSSANVVETFGSDYAGYQVFSYSFTCECGNLVSITPFVVEVVKYADFDTDNPVTFTVKNRYNGSACALTDGGSSGSSSTEDIPELEVLFSDVSFEVLSQSSKNEKGPVLPPVPDTDYLVQVAVKTNISEIPNKDILYGFLVSFRNHSSSSYTFFTEDLSSANVAATFGSEYSGYKSFSHSLTCEGGDIVTVTPFVVEIIKYANFDVTNSSTFIITEWHQGTSGHPL